MNIDPRRYCARCGRGFIPPAKALHKKFCSRECRLKHHAEEHKEGLKLLRNTPREYNEGETP